MSFWICLHCVHHEYLLTQQIHHWHCANKCKLPSTFSGTCSLVNRSLGFPLYLFFLLGPSPEKPYKTDYPFPGSFFLYASAWEEKVEMTGGYHSKLYLLELTSLFKCHWHFTFTLWDQMFWMLRVLGIPILVLRVKK